MKDTFHAIHIDFRKAFVWGVSAGIALLAIQIVVVPFIADAGYGQSSYYGQGTYYSQSSYYSQSYYQSSYYSQSYYQSSYYSQSYYQSSYSPSGPTYPITYTFQYESNGRCVNVSVNKSLSETDAILTVIHADGFSRDCDSIESSSRVLQRSVELTY